MRKTAIFLAKDARLLWRNRALVAILVLYPLVAAGIFGATFSRTGRPVPVGVVNLDRPTQEVLWMGGRVKDLSAALEVFNDHVAMAVELNGMEEARMAIEEGRVRAIIGIPGERGWMGGNLDPDLASVFVKEFKKTFHSFMDIYGPEEAGEVLGNEDTLLLAISGDSLPFLGEGFWVGGKVLDAGGLVEAFAGGACELRFFSSIKEAKASLSAGRVDAVAVLPPGLVHSLKTLDDIAFLRILLDQSNLLKAHFAEAGVRDLFSRLSDEAVRQKMRAVVSGLQVLVQGGDFFGTEVTGLGQLREDLGRVRERLKDLPDLAAAVTRSLDLADTVIRDLDVAAEYLRGTAIPVELHVSTVRGRPLSAKDAAVPSLVVLSLLWSGILCGAALMAWEKEEGMHERVAMTGLPAPVPVFSKVFLTGSMVALQAIFLFLLSSSWLGMPVERPGLILAGIALGSFSIASLGMVVGAALREVSAAMVAGAMISFVLLFLCGAVYPLEQMPAFLRWVAKMFPPTHAQEVVTGALLRARGWTDLWLHLSAMALLGLTFAATASLAWSRAGRS